MKEVLLSVCVTAILTAVYKTLAPTDKFGAQIKLLTACFFTVSVIGAVDGAVALFDLSDIMNADTSYNDYSVQFTKMTADETANELRRAISEKLAAEGITPENIYIDVNISDKGSISISEIKLVFGKGDYAVYSERAVVLARRLVGTGIKITAETDSRSKFTAKEREEQ